jgi:hypothetical protein
MQARRAADTEPFAETTAGAPASGFDQLEKAGRGKDRELWREHEQVLVAGDEHRARLSVEGDQVVIAAVGRYWGRCRRVLDECGVAGQPLDQLRRSV